MPDAPPETFDEAKPLLRVRPVGLVPLADRRRMGEVHGDPGAADAVSAAVADYHVGAVLDLPSADVPVSESVAARWGVPIGEILLAASDNVRNEAVRLFEHDGAIVNEGRAAAALTLLGGPRYLPPGDMPEMQRGRGLTPVIVIPDDTNCLIGFAEDPSSIVAIARVAEEVLSSTRRPVSITPLVADDDRWVPYTWPAEAAPAVGQLSRRWDLIRYERTRDVLTEWLEHRGEQLLVAKVMVGARPEDGRYRSMASWVDGMVNLIPYVDEVVLVRADGATTALPLTALLERRLLEPYEGVYPEYMIGTRFPTELIQAS
ncbi:hypothetical protein GCM10027067_39920 [Pseudactinotalea suaedae]